MVCPDAAFDTTGRHQRASVHHDIYSKANSPHPRVRRELLEELNNLFELIDRSSHIGIIAVRSPFSSSLAYPHPTVSSVLRHNLRNTQCTQRSCHLSEHTSRQSTCTACATVNMTSQTPAYKCACDVYAKASCPHPRVCRQLLGKWKNSFELLNPSSHAHDFSIQSRSSSSTVYPHPTVSSVLRHNLRTTRCT